MKKQTTPPNPQEQAVIDSLPQQNIAGLATVIRRDWKARGTIYFGAVPYLDALGGMDKASDNYGADSGHSIIAYFLSNANSWRGPVARAVKAELKQRAGIK